MPVYMAYMYIWRIRIYACKCGISGTGKTQKSAIDIYINMFKGPYICWNINMEDDWHVYNPAVYSNPRCYPSSVTPCQLPIVSYPSSVTHRQLPIVSYPSSVTHRQLPIVSYPSSVFYSGGIPPQWQIKM
jgi:hypothetical protein